MIANLLEVCECVGKTYRKGKRGKKKERMVSRGNVSYYAPRSEEKETL